MATRPVRWELLAPACRIVRKLRGGSQPLLIQALDGFYYVVKFLNNPQGVNVLFNEVAGTELYRACGLSVRPWKFIMVGDDLLDRATDHWIETRNGRNRPSTKSLAFGSRVVAGSEGTLNEIIAGRYGRLVNRDEFWMAWLIDSCAGHSDGRQALFAELEDRSIKAFFIDFGHLFSGPDGEALKTTPARSYFDFRVYPDISLQGISRLRSAARNLDVAALRNRFALVPEEWRTESAETAFSQCLERLSDAAVVRRFIEQILDAHTARKRRVLETWIEQAHRQAVLRGAILAEGCA
jgi:hypothetical protein